MNITQYSAEEAVAEAKELTAKMKSTGVTPDEKNRLRLLLDHADQAAIQSRVERIGARMGASPDPATPAGGIAAALQQKSWNYRANPAVVLEPAEYLRSKDSSFPTNEDELGRTMLPGMFEIGQDRRFLYPFMPSLGLGSDLAVADYHQTGSRSVSGSVERDPTDTSAKATLEVSVEFEVEKAAQVAIVMENLPQALLDNIQALTAFLRSEMQFQIDAGIDSHVLSQISAAGPDGGSSGANLVEELRNAISAMRANGENPTIAVLNPSDAAALDLFTVGADGLYLFGVRDTGSSSPSWGLQIIENPNVTDPMVIDPARLGALHSGTAMFVADPYTGLKTNTVNLRLEANVLFHVRDAKAAYLISPIS